MGRNKNILTHKKNCPWLGNWWTQRKKLFFVIGGVIVLVIGGMINLYLSQTINEIFWLGFITILFLVYLNLVVFIKIQKDINEIGELWLHLSL